MTTTVSLSRPVPRRQTPYVIPAEGEPKVPGDLLSLEVAATRAGLSVRALAYHARHGHLGVEWIGRRERFTTQAWLDSFLAQYRASAPAGPAL